MPPLPPEARTLRGWPLVAKVLWGMVPSLVLIFLVLGTIFIGLATPTEAGAMGAVGAIVLAMLHGRYSHAMMWEAMMTTMRITAMVVFILIGATVFSLVFQGVNGGRWIEHMLSSLPGGQIGFLIFTMVFVFFIAFFLDFFEIVLHRVPLLVPVAQALDIDPVWFGLLLCVNMQTSFMHPPFGFALFYLRAHRAEGGEDQRHLLGVAAVDRACSSVLVGDPDRLAGDGDLLDRRRARRSTPESVDKALEGLTLPDPAATSARPDFGEPPALDLE